MNINDLPMAESMPYWKTSKSGVESWLDKTEKMILDCDGVVHTRINGKFGEIEAIMIGFKIGEDDFKLIWPALQTKTDKDRPSAARQAATMVYHDTKARINKIKIFGPKIAFFDYLVLENGKSVSEMGGVKDVSKLLN